MQNHMVLQHFTLFTTTVQCLSDTSNHLIVCRKPGTVSVFMHESNKKDFKIRISVIVLLESHVKDSSLRNI